MRDLNCTYLPGEEILWRKDSTCRKWQGAFAVGRDNQWVIVRLPSGAEIHVHPTNVKPAKARK